MLEACSQRVALTFKDIDLVMKRHPGGGWTLIYKIDQRWVKNNRDPENIWYEFLLSPSLRSAIGH